MTPTGRSEPATPRAPPSPIPEQERALRHPRPPSKATPSPQPNPGRPAHSPGRRPRANTCGNGATKVVAGPRPSPYAPRASQAKPICETARIHSREMSYVVRRLRSRVAAASSSGLRRCPSLAPALEGDGPPRLKTVCVVTTERAGVQGEWPQDPEVREFVPGLRFSGSARDPGVFRGHDESSSGRDGAAAGSEVSQGRPDSRLRAGARAPQGRTA